MLGFGFQLILVKAVAVFPMGNVGGRPGRNHVGGTEAPIKQKTLPVFFFFSVDFLG